MEGRKSKDILVSISIKICSDCENLKSKGKKESHTRAQIWQMNVSSYSIIKPSKAMGILELRCAEASARNIPITCGQLVLCG